nr:zinc ribbon domain-containing protein [Gammaproteobacteria bacterium]
LMPAIVLGTFLWFHNIFGASVALWWLGQSAMDLAPYIADARAGQLLLLGGVTGNDRPGYHDWENLLSWLDLMRYDHAIAGGVDTVGRGLLILGLVWGGWVLYRQFKEVEWS